MIPLPECAARTLYRLESSQLTFGVYRDDQQAFLGVYQGRRPYLLTVPHFDLRARGARPVEALEEIPGRLLVREYLRVVDELTGAQLTARGGGCFALPSGELRSVPDIRPTPVPNGPLLAWLLDAERRWAPANGV